MNVKVTMVTKNLINTIISLNPSTKPWILSISYDHPYYKNKTAFWSQMEEVAQSCNLPRVCIGDFNYAISQEENLGGNLFLHLQRVVIWDSRKILVWLIWVAVKTPDLGQ